MYKGGNNPGDQKSHAMHYELEMTFTAEVCAACSCCLNINISLELNQQSGTVTRSLATQLSAVRLPFHLHGAFKTVSPQAWF